VSSRAAAPAPEIRWLAGESTLRAETQALARAVLTDDPSVELLQAKAGRRRIAKGVLASGIPCLVKHYLRPRRPGLRSRALAALGLSTGAREFANLRRLARHGVPAPEALAHLAAPGGDELLVLRFLDGEPLPAALARGPDRRELLHAVGRLVARMHESGTCHRDLHANNLWVTPNGPVLLDLQEALPLRLVSLRWRDRGELDASLAPELSLVEQLVLRMALLGVERPLGADAKQALRRLARAGAERRRAHVVSRTLRSLRPGRLYAPLRGAFGSGMRWREAPEERVQRALADPAAEPELEVVRYEAGSLAEALRWRFAGSPARHAWVASHGLRARGITAPAALAYVETRRGPLPRAAQLVLERRPEAREAASPDAIVELALRARRDGVLHRAWQLEPLAQPRLERLEHVHFAPRRGGHASAGLDSFVETRLASADPAARARALARYHAAKSFQVLP
jgi:hypothetical protein